MTLIVLGPITKDLIVIEGEKSSKTGGATYYQSMVFEKHFNDYLAIVNASDETLLNEFPDKNKVKLIKKASTHYFINNYPFKDNPDIRQQSSNFAEIPILKSDLENILPSEIDAFVINPLNRYDFPKETLEYLKTFSVPIFVSLQGFLREKSDEVNENYTIKLNKFDDLNSILSKVTAIFMDEAEANITGLDFDVSEIIITDGSKGSRIISDNDEVKINAVKCENIIDTTGCGDTYMAAYISHKLKGHTSHEAGNFASKIASEKISQNI